MPRSKLSCPTCGHLRNSRKEHSPAGARSSESRVYFRPETVRLDPVAARLADHGMVPVSGGPSPWTGRTIWL
jgi:hypothetical protein